MKHHVMTVRDGTDMQLFASALEIRVFARILKNKIQLDATYYFIMLMLGSTCFGHHYAHHQELTTIELVTT